ncbi:MAG: chemotaxis protein CheW [Pseudomonadota bacterium]
MARKFNLRQFQTDLSQRMQAAALAPAQASRLGFQAADTNWLVPLDEIDEVMPLPEIVATPGSKRWFRGMTNIRGNLYAVTDLSDFLAGSPTPEADDNRLLLVHRKHGVNAALIIRRSLGLRQISQFEKREVTAKWPYCADSYLESDGTDWVEIDLARLLADPVFLSVEAQ